MTKLISQLNSFNVNSDTNPLFEAECTTGNRSLSVDNLRILIALSSKEVGKMYFRLSNNIGPLELPCDGQTLKKVDYPYLYEEIGGLYGETDENFNLPNLKDYPFLAHRKTDNEIGSFKVDTMREIKGSFYDILVAGNVQTTNNHSGVFSRGSATQSAPNIYTEGTSTNSSKGVVFTSLKGVAGQEGSISPNVGSKTAPAHLLGIWVIRAKP